ncbi:SPOR domain-containing protein [Pseudomonadota bacterium]
MSQSQNHQHICQRSRGQFYVAPVLLDHRSYKRLLLAIIVLGVGSFFGGYISGFEKAEDTFMAEMGSMDLILPEVDVSDLALAEAQIPAVEEPGASIDVDSVDSDSIAEVVVKKIAKPITEKVIVAEKPVEIIPLPVIPVTTVQAEAVQVENFQVEVPAQKEAPAVVVVASLDESVLPVALGIGGPATESNVEAETASQADETQEDHSGSELLEAQNIVEDATEENARYSIQVGMYSNFDNAASRVEQLLDTNLSAYINDYKNKKDETRYNVRFGYFASFSSAKLALEIYQQSYAGSGYIARIKR